MYKPSDVTHITEKIGDTLFIDGVPHTECGRCGAIIRQFDGERIITTSGAVKSKGKIIKDGKKTAEIRRYKVLIGYWLHYEEESLGSNGEQELTPKAKPIVRNVPACLDCYNELQDMKAATPDKFRFFGDGVDDE